MLNKQSYAVRYWRFQAHRDNCVMLEQDYRDLFQRIVKFVSDLEDIVPGLTLFRVYESHCAHLDCPRMDVSVYLKIVGGSLAKSRGYGGVCI